MEQIRYGHVKGGRVAVPWLATDSEVFKITGGRFVTRNATYGTIELANTTEDIWGWAEAGDLTTSTSTLNVIVDLTAVFSIPLAYDASTYTVNYAQTIQGECCDLVVSTYQYANPTAATNKSILIVGGKAATGTTLGTNDGYILCMINSNQQANLGVGA